MSFKNRAATTIAAGAASFALALGVAPISGAQDAAPTATAASNNGTISIPTDSALDLRVVVADGKPTVMISNGSNGGQSGSNESGSQTGSSGSENATSTTEKSEPTDSSKPSDDKSNTATSEDLESRSAIDWLTDYIENKKDGETFGEFVDRAKKSAEEGKPVEKGNDSTGTAVLDPESGEVRFKLADLLKELGISPKGVDGTESSTDAENKANLDELAKLVDEGKVTFKELPEFVEISGKNGITANTEGVEPGTYPISGTAIDAEGNPKPFKFEIKVEDTGKSDDSTSAPETSSSAPSESDDESADPSAPSESQSAEPSEGSNASESSEPTSEKSDENDVDDEKKSEASSNKFYEDAEVRPGSSLTIKPKSDAENLDDYIFANAMKGEKWVDVKKDGTVDIEMSDGASEGDRDVYVAYVKKSDEAKFNDGDKSVIKLDKFNLKVSKDAKESEKETDATADQGDDKVDAMKKSLSDATNKLREGAKSGDGKNSASDNKSDGLYDDADVEIGESVTVSPNDAKDRVFAAVLFTTEDGNAVAEADNFPIDPMTEELDIDDKGVITISPSGELLKAGKYKASVITSKVDNAEEFSKLVENQDLEGIVKSGEVHEFNVNITGESSEDDAADATGAAAADMNQGGANGAGGNTAPAGEQPAAQPQAQYDPQSEGSLAQTGVSLHAQLGLAASMIALAGIAAVAMRRRGFTQ